MDLTGQTLLGKYEIEGLLGQGGMGAVWRARHSMTGRKLAVKVLDDGFVGNEQVAARFGREARAASLIQHPGIVEVLDLDSTDDGVPFIVMEFLEGETLASRIERRGRLEQAEMLRLAVMLLEALDAAHSHGVIHRDLKPENIYVVPAGRRGEAVKILDFGISQVQTAAESKLTMTGSVLGTPHYMSPEQAMGEGELDHRADLYAVGVVLYECVVGDVPYDAPNYNKLLRLILDEVPPPPRSRDAEITPEMEALILWAMEKDRKKRIPSAREMLEWLPRAARGEAPPYGYVGEPEVEIDVGMPELDMTAPRPAGSLPTHTTGSSGSYSLDSASLQLDDPPPTKARRATPPPAKAVPDEEGGAWQISPTLASLSGKALSKPPPSGAVELDMGLASLDAPGVPDLELDEHALRSSNPPGRPSQRPAVGTASSSGSFRPPHRAATSSGSFASPVTGTRSSSGSIPAVAGTRSSSGSYAAVTGTAGPSGSLPAPPMHSVPPRVADLQESMEAPVYDEPETPAWRRYLVIGIAAVAVFAGLVFLARYFVDSGDDVPVVETPTERPEQPDTNPSEAQWVSIRVVGLPPGARLSLDGLPATTPLRVRHGAESTLTITADGYVDRRIELQTDRDRTVHARMQPAVGSQQGPR